MTDAEHKRMEQAGHPENGWREASPWYEWGPYLSERACLAHAKQTLYDADFAENLTVSPERSSVSGRHGGYDATVTCDSAGHLAVVDVHGLDPDQIDWYRSTITKKF